MSTLFYAAVIPLHHPRAFASLLALASMLVASSGCGPREPTQLGCFELEAPSARRARNVIVVVGDTIRRDSVSLYGGAAKTPNLERLASEGVLFSRAYSTAPWTKPAVASLFTSQLPSKHGVTTHLDEQGRGTGIATTDVLAPERETLAEVFRGAGYATGAIVSNPWLVRPYGYEQGFDDFEDSLARWSSSATEVSLAASYWIASAPRDKPWFLYLHYLDPHLPYGPLERAEVLEQAPDIAADARPVNDDALAAIRGQSRLADGGQALDLGVEPHLRLLELAYEKGIERFDAGLGEVLASLEANGLLEETAIVVTSDHGESLYSRGFGNHGTVLYDDEVAVPLVLRWPGLEQVSSVDACVTSLIDVMPLLCTLAGLDCPEDIDGRDRITNVSAAAEAGSEGVAILEGVSRYPNHRGIVLGSHKLLWEPELASGDAAYRLFDLEADAGELTDIRAQSASTLEKLRPRLDAVAARDANAAPQRILRPEEEARLRELGYGQ